MPDFIFRANIVNFKKRLATETDPKIAAAVRKLFAEEEAKLADWLAKRPSQRAAE